MLAPAVVILGKVGRGQQPTSHRASSRTGQYCQGVGGVGMLASCCALHLMRPEGTLGFSPGLRPAEVPSSSDATPYTPTGGSFSPENWSPSSPLQADNHRGGRAARQRTERHVHRDQCEDWLQREAGGRCRLDQGPTLGFWCQGLVTRWGSVASQPTRWGVSPSRALLLTLRVSGTLGSAAPSSRPHGPCAAVDVQPPASRQPRSNTFLPVPSLGMGMQERPSTQHFGVPTLCLASAWGCVGPGGPGEKSPPSVRLELTGRGPAESDSSEEP